MNLELKRMIAILKEDNESLKAYANNVASGCGSKDITKLLNVMNNLWGQVAKKIEPMKELCAKTDELKEALQEFVKHLEK